METININGSQYVRLSDVPAAPVLGERAVIVADRGFIYVGQIAIEPDGSIVLSNAANIRKWERGGIGGLISDPVATGVVLDTMTYPVLFPPGTVLQIIRVPDTWGMEAAP